MAIRNAAKALIISEGKILLNKCVGPQGEIYYDIPGGGQHQYETMEEAVMRECLEETGRLVKIVRFAALCEEIYDNAKLREQYPDYVHRVHHVFLAELADDIVHTPTETDWQQETNCWMDLREIPLLDLRPRLLKNHLLQVLTSSVPLYLGAVHMP